MKARERARAEAAEMKKYREKLEEETRKAEDEPDELDDVVLLLFSVPTFPLCRFPRSRLLKMVRERKRVRALF